MSSVVRRAAACAVAVALPVLSAAARAEVRMSLVLDATDAGSKQLHVREEIPAKPGPATLLFAKWIPGEHMASGPIANFVDLEIRALGQPLAWRRDPVELYSLHVTVPAGCDRLEVSGTFLYPGVSGSFTSGPGATPALAVLNWNDVAIFPSGLDAHQITVEPTLKLPAGWSAASALLLAGPAGDELRFLPVPLTKLIDSPVLAGEHLVNLDLGRHDGALHFLSIAADDAADLEGASIFADGLKRLVEEALALFGARHYEGYRWLLALSEHVAHFGLEHHESSDDRSREEGIVDPALRRRLPGLLAHEYVHSWNGKYRRPAGLLSADYQRPMQDDLLWVYEGLTEHLGLLLPARAGLWSQEYYRDTLARIAARLDAESGRRWRPLADTAVAAPILYESPREWQARRRGTDFYEESIFVWLDVDTTLRAKSGGKVTLDDFCKRFHGGTSTGPQTVSYTEEDVVRTLDGLVPMDWKAFFDERVGKLQPRLPMAGLEAAGWRLVFSATPNPTIADEEKLRDAHDWTFSLGVSVGKDGIISDVEPDSPAGRAGVTPHEKVLAIAGFVYSPHAVENALKSAMTAKEPIELITAAGDFVHTYHLDYHAGPRYPHLERVPGRPDLLSDIAAPHAGPTAAAAKP